MKENQNNTLYRLIRDYMNAVGTSRTTVAALKSYMEAIRRVQCSATEFKALILELNTVIRNTQPKIVSLMHLLEMFETEMQEHFGTSVDETKRKALEILSRKLSEFEQDTTQLSRNCTKCVTTEDFIIVHSPTAYIRDALVRAHVELKIDFRVLVLKQEFYRSKDLLNAMIQNGVAHLLINEHNLSHYLSDATKLFISAVSITADQKAITGPGTANVVSICHANKLPVYLFAETVKFSHASLSEQQIYKEQNHKIESGFSFDMTAFSHDFVDLFMVDHIITEEGEMDLRHPNAKHI